MDRIIKCITDALDHMTGDLFAEKELRKKESALAVQRGKVEEIETAIKRLDNMINGERHKADELEMDYRETTWVFRRKRGAIQEQIDGCAARIEDCEEEKRRVLLNHGIKTIAEYERFKDGVDDMEEDVKQGAKEMDQAGMRGLFAVCKINMHSDRLIKLAHARLSSISDEDFVSLIPGIKKLFDDKKLEISASADLSAEEKENLMYGISYYKKSLGYEERLRKIRKKF